MDEKKLTKKIFVLVVCLFALSSALLLFSIKSELNGQIKEMEEDLKPANYENTLVVWTISGSLQQVLEQTVQELQSEYPDIKFKIVVYSSEVYPDMILNAAATNQFPDIFYTWGDTNLKELVNMNVVEDITDEVEIENLKNQMVPNALSNYTYNEKIYGLPVFGWDACLFCNTEIFNRYGVKIPENYDELLACIDTFKKYGITPISLGGQDAWTGSLYYMLLVLDEGRMQTKEYLKQGLGAFAEPEFNENAFKAAEKMEKLIERLPFQEDYEKTTAYDAVYQFSKGNAAMHLDGSWISSELEDASSSLVKDKIKVIAFPGKDLQEEGIGLGGYSDGFALRKGIKYNTLKKKIYVELIKRLSDRAVEKKGIGLPIYKNQKIDAQKFKIMTQCYEIFPTKYIQSAYDKLFRHNEVNLYNDALLEFMQKKLSAKEFVNQLSGNN